MSANLFRSTSVQLTAVGKDNPSGVDWIQHDSLSRPAGRSMDDVVISPQVSAYVTDDVEAARDRERPHIAFTSEG